MPGANTTEFLRLTAEELLPLWPVGLRSGGPVNGWGLVNRSGLLGMLAEGLGLSMKPLVLPGPLLLWG